MSVGGYSGVQRFDRIFHLAGTRLFEMAFAASLPPLLELTAEPSGATDLGTIVGQDVTITTESRVQSVDIGRVPTPARFYQEGQSGKFTGRMQEYQVEMIGIAVGSTVDALTGASRVYIGGKLGDEKRVLAVDDFDLEARASSREPWSQFWFWAKAQVAGSFGRNPEKAYFTIPFEYNLLVDVISDRNVLIQMYAIDA